MDGKLENKWSLWLSLLISKDRNKSQNTTVGRGLAPADAPSKTSLFRISRDPPFSIEFGMADIDT